MSDSNKAIIRLLLKARLAGDTRTWDRKSGLSREALRGAPDDFYIDSRDKHIVGLTHEPTGFRFHLPENQIQSFKLREGEDMTRDQVELLKAGCFSVYKQAGMPEHLWEPMLKQAIRERAPLRNVNSVDHKPEPKTIHQRKWEAAQVPKATPKPGRAAIPSEAVIPSLTPPAKKPSLDIGALLPKATLPLRK